MRSYTNQSKRGKKSQKMLGGVVLHKILSIKKNDIIYNKTHTQIVYNGVDIQLDILDWNEAAKSLTQLLVQKITLKLRLKNFF